MDDYAAKEYKDYLIKGDTKWFYQEMKKWGAEWSREHRSWIITNTNEISPDYQALIEMGLDLLPLQESTEEKMIMHQLGDKK